MTTVEQPQVGAAGFLAALTGAGFETEARDAFAVFTYQVEVGSLAGQSVMLALAVPGDWPITPPPGPHVKPRLGHPGGNVHDSPLGPDWEYWSRPVPNWPADRSLRRYLRHLRTLFAQR